MTPWHDIAGGDPRLLLIADHASDRVPDGIALGVAPAVMREHVAVDLGVAPLAERLCALLDCPAILGGVSRLVIDLNREEESPGLIPATSDGHVIAGNAIDAAERSRRCAELWRPYHRHIAERIAEWQPKLLISLHSFTPALRLDPAPRPWEIGILYNQDDRAARRALPALAAAGIVAGDNLPYSGKLLNATMNRHGEANRIPYLGIEVRQDLLAAPAGVTHWAARLAPIIRDVAAAL